ncbi:MAG: BolA/IbaG family iron-sulfur metabolism protein [Methylophilaceae bacterium]|nr:BolA/IbaG family iron-sulfur metabolism protein [Methylophilaceae bacterium]
MPTAKQVEDYIRQGLPCDYVVVHGNDGQHFEAVVVSPLFEGKRMVQQHQLVYQALGDRMRNEIHALSLRTFTPQAWAQSSQELTEEQ